MKRRVFIVTAVCLLLLLAGCGAQKDKTSTGSKWQYSYAGVEHHYLEAITGFLVDYDAKHLKTKDGMIPAFTVIEIDNEDPENIGVWGIFDIYNYTLSGDTLVEENGTRLFARFTLKEGENGVCERTGAAVVEGIDEAAFEKLCEGHAQALEGFKNPVVTEETRRFYISEFVKKSGIAAAKYQPAGRQPLPIEYAAQPSPVWVSALPEAAQTDVLMLVDITIGSNAVFSMHEKGADGTWTRTVDVQAYIGKNGPGKMREGDLRTPLGTFGFNRALGINDDPGCAIPYVKVTDDHYWVGDSTSPRYNTLADIREYADFNTEDAEHIVDYPNAYKYILNTTYNEEHTPYRGNAIFLHCYREQRTYTGGCIGIPEETMKFVMQRVRPDSKIIIRVMGH
ncbi:MAG: L,D-transpeptidase family protein [Lachnospiraceae bacterium]|nr:L,D-transpeptidase family protein [Lachnospiraceae bacterium]